MEENPSSTIFDAKITGIRFGFATSQEICKASISDCPISHASQLSNPFLGLPLEAGRCESCGTAEPGQCEGHFGYIELPTPIYHPDHVGELKRMLSLLCLKCLKVKNRKVKNIGVAERVLSSCCEETSQISINEFRTTDGACYLELKIPSRSVREGFWNFLEKYGFRYGRSYSRALLPSEVMAILKKIPKETRKKLDAKGYFPQDGYILQHLPVPPNCLSVPDVSDGISTMSTDYSITLLKKVLKQVEVIKNSRSGMPNFESQEIEANDLQAAVAQYFQFRGTGKASRDVDTRFGVNKEINASSTKAWLEKMKTLFIRKGSGFSSRSVITGDSFKGVSEIGLPFEIAQKITFEERVNQHNMEYLQRLVDEKLCLTYRDGMSTYSLREGSKGHTFLKPGQIVHRRIMDGDIVFINRPPTTHKHSLQALSVYIHDDHTVKINPLICGPLSADFDGDCIHLFYPQSLEAKAEVVELFSVEKQLLSSHTGNFNLQLGMDSLLSLKLIFQNYYLSKAAAQQLAMVSPNSLPGPAVLKSCKAGPLWTAAQILQITLPHEFDCSGERHTICKSELLRIDFNRDVMQSIVNDLVTSIFFLKGPKAVLGFFNSLQPLLMENLYSEGFSVSLRDLFIPGDILKNIQVDIQKISRLLRDLNACYSESIALQLENYLRSMKKPVTDFILGSSAIGHLVDSKSESALSKVVQQIGFLGLQLADRGKFYTGTLVNAMSSLFQNKYPSSDNYPTEKYGLVGRPLFQGLDPYQEMVHSISSREVIVRSSRGLTEPGTLFKNLMAVLRDVMICHDGTVRNMCSNSIIQFEYGVNSANIASEFATGDPVGVLAATAMSNPAYKAVLDSSPSSNSSWEMMKEILLCGVNFKNDSSDRRVMLYLNDCDCGRKHCQENAACVVKNHLAKVSLKESSVDFLIEYKRSETAGDSSEIGAGLVGHIHLNKTQLKQSNISMNDILEKCQDTINLCRKKKKVGNLFKRIDLSFSNCCSFCHSAESKWTDTPCLQFLWIGANDDHLERISHILADTVCPVLLETIIKGDPMVSTVNIIWINSDATSIRSPSKSQKGELALDIILEKKAVRKSGDAWRVLMDSCLPVIHLIDTKRSIPYAIKQVQELLGISCAFEQAVQRLSTSVTMVTKGVLKDHLLLLANSMTCGGNLIGFNAGGIKSLSRSLNLQVPFTEATLFTPRKCFERAAEKCHVDALTSIVASCSWGKHVSVGTGSPFEILWDTRKAELNQQNGLNVYDFLHLVSSSSNKEDMGTSCLGEEIDYLDQEDEYMEFDLSPVRDSGTEKPTFEDGNSFAPDENEWVQTSTTDKDSGSWDQVKKAESPTLSGWGVEKDGKDANLDGSWGQALEKVQSSTPGWGVDKSEKDGKDANLNGSWAQAVEKVQSPTTTGWRLDKCEKHDTFSEKEQEYYPKDNRSAWGKKVDSVEKDRIEKAEKSTWASANASKSSGQFNWGKDVLTEDSRPTQIQEEQSVSVSAWGEKQDSEGKGWMEKDDQNNWSNASTTKQKNPSNWVRSSGEKDWSGRDDRNTLANAGTPKSSSQFGWGRESDESGWNKKKDQSSWAFPSTQKDNNKSSWGQDAAQTENVIPVKAQEDSSRATDWDALGSDGGQAGSGSWSSWGKKIAKSDESGKESDRLISTADGDSIDVLPSNENLWEAKVAGQGSQSKPSNAWASSIDWGKVDSQSPREAKKDSPVSNWNPSPKEPNDSGFTPRRPFAGRGDSNRGRGRGRSGGDWKNNRGRGRSGGRQDASDDFSALGTFTVTRQRMDLFTVEEQDILSDVEAIMKNIRRIMNQTGYNDGDPISGDDQSYMVDNVLNYHPDKAAKMGAGLKHIMVSRHQDFQDSRCFYAVSVDGAKQDFSYRKCVENFLKEKYPDKAEAFIPKYYRRQQARTGWNKDRGSASSEARTLGWKRDRTPAPDEAGTPRWCPDRTPAPEEAGTPGWSQERNPVADESGNQGWNAGHQAEAGTPGWNTERTPAVDVSETQGWNTDSSKARDETGASGWNKGPTPARDEAGTPGW
ncbi:DNA-directed RNA polymerase V subunit 1 [Olea europaea var. sylvestris]|uniref:DNA-directed RNA polymerase V subunit 1 n=1 Tax=Olea europaea var. sylvestris TaxID=158386 RepID=UPI000C1CF2CD|nr:DNA-directed RNA polymerase V subunit 1 [Olea europaea var. sylvestris]XP_022866102.1 DNA-directed RNA polymerase V subunit 1 [Olea europaea var. sylvestris]XP_022866103.1 DNA-directed RNA polymerase V subunit 1 [Olea europaea var. sylvestris]XP_022866104.1 DNA-directed RNA polymerase V subunit 1 [Olea europaea var. sylvestris]